MGDIFDSIAAGSGGTGAPSSDIFDQIAQSSVTPPPETTSSLGGKIWDDVKGIPGAIVDTVESIPSGIKNVADLPYNLTGAAHDAYENYIKKDLFGGVFTPFNGENVNDAMARYDQLDRTFRGVAKVAGGVAGGGVLGPAGVAVSQTGVDKLNQLTGVDAPTTPQQDSDALLKNLIQTGGMSVLGDAAAAPLRGAANAVEPISAEDSAVQSLGINPSQVARAAKFKGPDALSDAIQGAKERGVFSNGDDPVSVQQGNNSAIADIANQIHGQDGLLAKADAAQTGVTIPQFTRAQQFITDNPFQADTLSTQLSKRLNTINQVWDGTISGLSKVKSMIGNIAYTGLTDSRALDQALYQDLRSAVEDQANTAVPGLGDQVAGLNDDLSEHYTLQPIIQKALDKSTSADLKGNVPRGTFLDTAVNAVKGAGQGGAVGLAAGVAGVPHLTLPLAATIAAMRGGAALLRNPTIGGGASSVLDATASAIPPALTVGGAAANNNPVTESDLESLMGSVFSRPSAAQPDTRKATEAKIDSNPYYSALYQAESSRNPNAANSQSSAKGGFQFLDSTAKAVGLKDPFDLAQSYSAVQTLTDSNARYLKGAGVQPNAAVLYAAHYLGAPLAAKFAKGAALSSDEQLKVNSFKAEALPRFLDAYKNSVTT